jgi:hypothetical protein
MKTPKRKPTKSLPSKITLSNPQNLYQLKSKLINHPILPKRKPKLKKLRKKRPTITKTPNPQPSPIETIKHPINNSIFNHNQSQLPILSIQSNGMLPFVLSSNNNMFSVTILISVKDFKFNIPAKANLLSHLMKNVLEDVHFMLQLPIRFMSITSKKKERICN